jgi:hypothetical protein
MSDQELWTKYLDPEYRTLGRYALWREEGKWGSYLQLNGKMFSRHYELEHPAPRNLASRPLLETDR